ncbi:MAG: hypothetical protein KME12_26185 [Trichocoleus desertorum ATA4-8-CV12]|jgi:hypothetical protein|nr:hypothetical protein [Trichocoleus desertorum ATA4-8-CV12]
MASVVIRHAYLWEVLGQAAQHNGVVFIPVSGELYNQLSIRPYRRNEESPMFPLRDYIGEQLPRIAQIYRNKFSEIIVGDILDAVWVRARISAVFSFTPLSLPFPDYKYALIEQMFVACEPCDGNGAWVAYPFICEDYDLRAGLRFSSDPSSDAIHHRLAKAFWELLLLEPDLVQPFRDSYLHYDKLDDEEWLTVTFMQNRVVIELSNFPIHA